MTTTPDTKLTGRSGYQIEAARKYLGAVDTTGSTVTWHRMSAAHLLTTLDGQMATNPELANGQRDPHNGRAQRNGRRVALQSLRRALVDAAEAQAADELAENTRHDLAAGEVVHEETVGDLRAILRAETNEPSSGMDYSDTAPAVDPAVVRAAAKAAMTVEAYLAWMDELDELDSDVQQLRDELEAAVAARGRRMIEARAAGVRLTDITRATSLTSSGAAEAAMKRAGATEAEPVEDSDEDQ